MPESYLHSIAGWVVTAQLGLLAALLGWIGKRMIHRLDNIERGLEKSALDHANSMAKMQKEHSDDLLEIYRAMKAGDDSLHDRVTSACGRISRLEAACEIQHRI